MADRPDLEAGARALAERRSHDVEAAVRLGMWDEDVRAVLDAAVPELQAELERVTRELGAVDSALPEWEGERRAGSWEAVGRVQTIRNLVADRAELEQAREALGQCAWVLKKRHDSASPAWETFAAEAERAVLDALESGSGSSKGRERE